MKRLRALLPILPVLILGGVIVSAACQGKQRHPSRYLIPKGYIGWVRIDFKVNDAPPLPIEDGHYLFKFPPSGHLQTSSDIEYGWSSSDDFYYYSGDDRQQLKETMWGGGGMVWGQSNGSSQDGSNNVTAIFENFFVGTEEQFKKCGNERDENYDLKIGSLDETTLKKCTGK